MVELHLHGGRTVTQALLSALGAMPDLRAAEPGEFTRRAFLNGVIDLAQAEGLADLIAAETEMQRRQAQMLAGGTLSRRVADWQNRIVALSAHLEAVLEFADEADVTCIGWADPTNVLAAEIEEMLAQPTVERLRDGIRVALAGPPNSGKSTLLNAIVGRDAAITSSTAGTTRDLIEVPVALGGTPFVLTDMAGLRSDTADTIEDEGIARACAAIGAADIVLWLGDPSDAPERACVIKLHPRADEAGREDQGYGTDLRVSARTGRGIADLVGLLSETASMLLPGPSDVSLNRRQHDTLAESVGCLRSAQMVDDPVFAAEELRAARSALDRLTGKAGTEEMLSMLFGRFCIGK